MPEHPTFECRACGSRSPVCRSPIDMPLAEREMWRTYLWPYEISSHGELRNFLTGRTLNPRIKPPMGYRETTLLVAGRRLDRYIHRMVLEAFVGPSPSPKHVARHLNGDASNNRLDNLAWGTSQENSDDAFRHGTRMRGERQHRALLTESAARAIKQSDESNEILGARYDVHPATIRSLRRGLSWAWVE